MDKIEDYYRTEEAKPAICCLAITKGCMFECKMCYLWRENKPQKDLEVDILYWEKLIGSLKDFAGKDLCVNFVGGESLTSRAALPLIKYASGLGCGTVLTSNAYLINQDMSKKIADSGLKEIYLSLDSFNEKTHDFLRGVQGSYQRVISAIEYLHRHAGNVRIRINTVITAINLEEILDLAKRVIGDSRIISVNFLAITQPFDTRAEDKWHEKNEYNFLWPKDPDKVESVLEALIKLKEENMRKIMNPASQFKAYKAYFKDPQNYSKQTGCDIYKQVINVSSNGQISLCFHMEHIGNIKQDKLDMRKIWNSSLTARVVDGIRNCKKNCHLRVVFPGESGHHMEVLE